MPPDGLIVYDAKGNASRLIESLAADVVADALSGRVAWDGEATSWLAWKKTHWQPLATSALADRLIAEAVTIGAGDLGYRPYYLTGITQLIQRRGLLSRSAPPAGTIPFLNGLLDLATGTLTDASPGRAMDWCLPHQYDPHADCPAIREWLLTAVEGEAETVELLRAWLAALVRGIPLQRFLMLLGRGGTGKGTFQRLAAALVGERNTAISALRDLEGNRFETAKLFGKRLCMVNEAGKHGGALNMLKAVTGGDSLPLERKHQQQTGSFVFDGLVLMATNEDLQSSDMTSGLERRRITVRFPRTATPEERAQWDALGGEAAVLHREIPGLINWLLDLSTEDILHRIDHPPERVRRDNLLGMAAGNSVADWLIERMSPSIDDWMSDKFGPAPYSWGAGSPWVQVGEKRQLRDSATGEVYFEHADTRLYPSYLTFCQVTGRNRPVAMRKFTETVIDIAETLGAKVAPVKHPKTRAACIGGLRFRRYEGTESGVCEWAI